MKTILAPVDFSKVSARIVTEATALARAVAGEVVLLNVIAPPFAGPDDVGGKGVARAMRRVAKSASKRIEQMRKRVSAAGVSARAVELIGLPVVLILREAKKLAADYIVIGSHGHNAFYNLVVGSTTNGVMKEADCPVLVVRESRFAAQSLSMPNVVSDAKVPGCVIDV